MRVTRLVAALALCASGCHPSTPPGGSDPGGDPGPGDTDPGPGTDNDPPDTDPDPGVIPEYGLCATTADCLPGLQCVEGAKSYCMKPCVVAGDCGAGRICPSGYCENEVHYYEALPDQFSDCGVDAILMKNVAIGPDHCAPICDVGDLPGYQAVLGAPACPPLPSWLHGSAPTCRPVTYANHAFSVCVTEVDLGEVCDQGALSCNYLGSRDIESDTDPTHEATPNNPDPGAPACLPDPSDPNGSRCLRVCSIDAAATTSPCACPSTDHSADPEDHSWCTDPTQGLVWECYTWTGISPDIFGCVPVEPCTADPTVCADNTASGLVTCKPAFFDPPSPTDTCQ